MPLPQLRQCQRGRGLRDAVPKITSFQMQFSQQLTTAVLKGCTSQRLTVDSALHRHTVSHSLNVRVVAQPAFQKRVRRGRRRGSSADTATTLWRQLHAEGARLAGRRLGNAGVARGLQQRRLRIVECSLHLLPQCCHLRNHENT